MILPLNARMYYLDGSLLKVPLFLYSSFYFTISIGAVTGITRGLQMRIESISHILKTLSRRPGNDKIVKVSSSTRNSDAEIISTLADIYQDIIRVCDGINVYSGPSMMLGFGLIFFYTLFTSFTIYTDLVNEGFLTASSDSSLGFSIFYNIVLVCVIYMCSELKSEVKTG